MNLWNWLPALNPRNSFEDVVRQLIEGLRNGTIVLDKVKQPQTDHRAVLPQEAVSGVSAD